jgi:hypothetical protein
MFRKTSQVNEQFFKKLYSVQITLSESVTKNVLVRYAKKSSEDYSEESDQQIYPCIAIQDYTPTLKPEWWIDLTKYPYIDKDTLTEENYTGLLFSRPVWMLFNFDVSVVSKSYSEYTALKDYMLANYVSRYVMLFDNPDLFIGETDKIRVPYTINISDVPRNDGVFETNYEFSLSVWMLPQEPEVIDLIKGAIIELVQSDVPTMD